MTHDPLCTTVRNTEMSEALCDCDRVALIRTSSIKIVTEKENP